MSDAVSALDERVVIGDVTLHEGGLRGMITLRGDLSDKAMKALCKTLIGSAPPDPGKIIGDADRGIAWMSPDELLILLPYNEVSETFDIIDQTLKERHYLAENVSDARALISVEGPFAREVIAKLAPADLHPDIFGPDDFRRTRLAQAAAAFWMRDAEIFEVVCFRSVAEYVFDLLTAASEAGPVGHLGK